MKTMTLGKRLFLAFLATSAITLMLGVSGYYGTASSNVALGDLGTNRLPSVRSLLTMVESHATIDSAENALLSREIALKMRQEKYAAIAARWKDIEESWKVYEPLPQTTEEEATWKKFVPAWEAWKKDHQAFIALCQQYDRTLDAQQKGGECYANMVSQGLVANTESCQKSLAKLAPLIEFYRAKTDNAQATYAKADLQAVHSLLSIKAAQTDIDSSENALLDRNGTLAERQGTYARIAAAWQTLEAASKLYQALEQAPEASRLWQEFQTPWSQWKTDHEKFMALCKAYDGTIEGYRQGNELYKKMTEQGLVKNAITYEAANQLLERLVQINEQAADEVSKASMARGNTLKAMALAGMVLGVVLAVLLGTLITRSISSVLKRICQSLSSGADQTAAAASQVSAASQSLAEGASEQAASLEETSSSLEEMASMTKRNADNADKANDLARQARVAADNGAKDMEAMAVAMEAIKQSSDDIAKIIKTIDEIAFQTNILALNAAVEAARAGEAGMGFAVVAEEVRSLAQRSALAAKETAGKIEAAITKTTQGVDLSTKVAQGLQEIVAKARQVDELAAEVASASKEQSQGITQVNTAVTQMDKVTQSNAANAEESASASEELNAQADALKEAVGELLVLVDGHKVTAGQKVTAAKAPVAHNGNGHTSHSARSTGTAQAVKRATAPEGVLALGQTRKGAIPLEGDFKDF